MPSHMRYRVATADLIFDTIQGEVIVLDMGTGTYFQLTGNAVPAWNWLVSGASVDEIVTYFARQYPNQTTAIESGLANFVQALTTEGLLVLRDNDAAIEAFDPPLAPTASETFVEPTLLKYTDMQSLLLLDPIHDVDTPGWPIISADKPA